MRLTDRLYGRVSVTKPIILALIKSAPLQRLKGIAQYGVPDPYYHLKNYTRYEHSLGVMLLLRRLGATLEEQLAGLLHDVSHTAFSHIVDWVGNTGATESFQDDQHVAVLTRSVIPPILKAYGFSLKRIADYHLFTLLEREAPDLCADRLDYALREMPPALVAQILPAVTTQNHQIVFAHQSAALLFAQAYLKLQTEHWGGFEAASRYRLFADILREALTKKVITRADFWQDDAFVLRQLLASGESGLISRLESLKSPSLAHLPLSGQIVYKKFRYVDPLFIQGKTLVRLSAIEPVFKTALDQARRQNALGVPIARLA